MSWQRSSASPSVIEINLFSEHIPTANVDGKLRKTISSGDHETARRSALAIFSRESSLAAIQSLAVFISLPAALVA